jgi:hypothetical protein
MQRRFLSMGTVVLMFFGFVSCNKESIQPENEIPSEVKTYVSTHFPGNTILQSIKDKDGFTLTYDVILSDNIQLEFNRSKEIINIDSDKKLPDSVVPTKILEYVAANYPSNFITDWEIDGKNQQIELDNGLDLEFDKSGNFKRIDN